MVHPLGQLELYNILNNSIKMLKGIIFDFDGVIVESVKVKTEAFAEMYRPYGKKIVKKVVEHHTANGGISRFEKFKLYHKIFLNIDLTASEVEEMANKFSNLVVEKVISSPYVPGALEYIQKSFEQYKLFISTGTPTEEMKQILKGRKIAQYFTEVFGSPEKKSNHIKIILSIYGISSNELVFYGDSDSDLEAAAIESVDFILRLHKYNLQYFHDYTGITIKNFNSHC